MAKIIKNVMASATEAEVYSSMQERLCHSDNPAPPLKTNNNMAEGILNGTIKQKRSKAIDM
eukprot:jgi/Psemu1/21917/gm1.21917_g